MNNSMKNHTGEGRTHLSVRIILLIATLFLSISCVNRIDDEEEEIPGETSSLRVTTRAENTPIPYPIRIYAFDAEGKQAAMSTIEKAGESGALMLAEGSYHLVALGGTEGCTLPDSPLKTSNITLPASNYSTTALMAGSADVTLSGADATADITLTYRMASIQLSLSDIPATVTAVAVRFSSLYNAMTFGGDYAGEGSTASIACTKNESLWEAPLFYTLPGIGQTLTLSIEMTEAPGATKTYGYTHKGKFEAATPYILTGGYKKGFSVDGSITAEGWGSPKNIGFTFGGSGTGDGGNTGGDTGGGEAPDPTPDPTPDTYPVTAIPTAATLWNNHAVVAVQNATATSADLLLLSLEEWEDVASANSTTKPTQAATTAAAYTEAGLSGWRIPTKAEADMIEKQCGGIGNLNTFNELLARAGSNPLTGGTDSHGDPALYLCEDATHTYSLKSASEPNQKAGGARTYLLRAVKTVHVTVTPGTRNITRNGTRNITPGTRNTN